jgi:TonB family protein
VVGSQVVKTRDDDSGQNPGKQSLSWWWIAPCAFVLVAAPFIWRPIWNLAGAMTLPASPGPSGGESASRLGLSATHEGSDWRLVWSREALQRLGAVGAMLTIRDGGVDRLQFLSPLDLNAGAILYVPKTSDLLFNLRVTLPEGPDVEEQIRVLGQDQDAMAGLTYTPAPRRIGEAARTGTGATASQSAPVKQFQPPPAPAAAVPTPADLSLPDVRLPGAPPPALRFTGSAPPPPRPAPAQSQTPPVQAPQVITPVTTHVDPAPLRTVIAQWPRGAARQGRMDIRIRVRIDEKGRVASVMPLDRNVANFPFVDSALAAARLWTFSPATENGKPVASETVLTFKFNP